jgi:hypothetical protein
MSGLSSCFDLRVQRNTIDVAPNTLPRIPGIGYLPVYSMVGWCQTGLNETDLSEYPYTTHLYNELNMNDCLYVNKTDRTLHWKDELDPRTHNESEISEM